MAGHWSRGDEVSEQTAHKSAKCSLLPSFIITRMIISFDLQLLLLLFSNTSEDSRAHPFGRHWILHLQITFTFLLTLWMALAFSLFFYSSQLSCWIIFLIGGSVRSHHSCLRSLFSYLFNYNFIWTHVVIGITMLRLLFIVTYHY